MKWTRVVIAGLAVIMAWPAISFAREGARNYQIHNRLRLEYDDNIREQEKNKTSSFKIVEEIEFLVNFNLENTFVSVRYKPTFVWWEDRSEGSTDLHHEFDFIFNHKFTPRLALSLKDTFRYAELPEAVERGTVIRQRNDYLYNSLLGTLTYQVTRVGRVETSARHIMLRYDKSDVSRQEDYDIYVGGLTYRHNIVPETALMGDLRYEMIEYKQNEFDRDSDSYQIGGGVEHIFSPNLMGNFRAGYQVKEYSDSSLSSDSSPYADLGLVIAPSPATRITLGAGYSLLESDVFPYANQERMRLFAGVSLDLTPRLTLNIITGYIRAKYKSDDVVRFGDDEVARAAVEQDLGVDLSGGTEQIIQISSRLTYRIGRSNWLEAGWQFTNLDSDVRQDFDRNRISLGWKTQL